MILSLQLYSLRDFMSFEQMLSFCKNKGLSYVEPGGLYDLSPVEMTEKLQNYGLKAHSFHFGLEPLQQNWQEWGNTLPKCGATDFVMPFANPDSFDELRELAAKLQDIAEKLKGLGIRLHYHNHAHEIAKVFDGKCFMDWLLELAPALYWQVDVGWVTAGGSDVSTKLYQWKDRITMLHIKDIFAKDNEENAGVQTKNEGGIEVVVSAAAQQGGQPARIGDGIVDFEAIFSTAKKLNITTFILENDNPETPDAFADSGIALVKKYTK